VDLETDKEFDTGDFCDASCLWSEGLTRVPEVIGCWNWDRSKLLGPIKNL